MFGTWELGLVRAAERAAWNRCARLTDFLKNDRVSHKTKAGCVQFSFVIVIEGSDLCFCSVNKLSFLVFNPDYNLMEGFTSGISPRLFHEMVSVDFQTKYFLAL